MSIDITAGSNPLNVPLLNSGAAANCLDISFLGKQIGNGINELQVQTVAINQTLNGTTAGSIKVYQVQKATRMIGSVLVDVVGYENDTATNQTITYSIPFVSLAPLTITNTSGLTISTTGTVLTITAPDNTTVYNGVILLMGLI